METYVPWISSIYEKCPLRLKFQKEGAPVNQSIEPKKVFVRVHSMQASVPKFTGISFNGCQYKAGSSVGVNAHLTFGRENLIGEGKVFYGL